WFALRGCDANIYGYLWHQVPGTARLAGARRRCFPGCVAGPLVEDRLRNAMCRSRAAFDLSSACREFSRSLRASSRVIWNGLGATVRLCARGSGACFLAISSAVIFTSDLLLRIACSDVTRLMVARRMNSSLCMAIESDDPVSLLSG